MTSRAARPTAAWQRELGALAALAGPLALAQLAQIAINTTDLVMMGWLGTEALAAGGLAVNIWILPALFGIGVASAIPPLVAEALGARQPRRVRRAVRQGLWVTAVVTVPPALALAFSAPLLQSLGQTPAVAADAEAYLRAAALGLPFAAFTMALRGFVTSFGHTRAVLAVMAAAVVVNALSNYALMFGHFGLPRLELVGAGISSTLVNIATFAALAVLASRVAPYRRYRIFARLWRPDWTVFAAVLKLGLPIGLTLLLEVGMFSAAALLVGTLGPVPLAAHNIALQLCAIIFMVPLGVSQAATIRVALAAGRRDGAGIRRVGTLAAGLAVAIMTVPAAAFLLVPGWLVRPFLDDPAAQTRLVETAVGLLGVAALFQIADGLQVVGAGLLRGLKDTTVPMLYAGFGYWLCGFGAAAALLWLAEAGARGVWVGLLIGLTVTAALALRRFFRRACRLGP
ncbi:MAG: MATE family efflux transporter [Alphaproteobacteria bacterium]